MRRRPVAALLLMSAALLLVGVVSSRTGPVSAQTGDGFDLTWHVTGGGGAGGPLTGSGFTLRATIAQTAIGTYSGPTYQVGSGYWYGTLPYYVYLPLVSRGFS